MPVDDLDSAFKALADPTRRHLLDLLRATNGQTLGELCAETEMTRQATSQHLAVLEAANLVSTVRHGRQKLHYLNPVPIHDIQARWIGNFEEPRLRTLRRVKQRLESTMTDKPSYVYVTYIATTPEKLWQALTDPEITAEYWDHHNVSDWTVGSSWEHRRLDDAGTVDVVGTVLEVDPPVRLVQTWADAADPAKQARVEYDVKSLGSVVRLTVSHFDLDEDDLTKAAGGWPAVLSNLKSLLETGAILPMKLW
ncbi:ArsR/SmtB family transcription factor [Antrihabitans cavernicola]|uniref:Metalloregulator ArsR/SmtB family transcription factor n=1 Tax=Antrihabitans cavernicola TaxID=2495913 RepID=A0A5A7SBH3_9NOCA|nr:metalloregulator ArsR/SmtB family transcription factor [Spelaeibacter cavernicola]KAA0023490.1 metalloregulator ArsR/SmtB family transcription factor [Spelaeibacter cavernicola]